MFRSIFGTRFLFLLCLHFRNIGFSLYLCLWSLLRYSKSLIGWFTLVIWFLINKGRIIFKLSWWLIHRYRTINLVNNCLLFLLYSVHNYMSYYIFFIWFQRSHYLALIYYDTFINFSSRLKWCVNIYLWEHLALTLGPEGWIQYPARLLLNYFQPLNWIFIHHLILLTLLQQF